MGALANSSTAVSLTGDLYTTFFTPQCPGRARAYLALALPCVRELATSPFLRGRLHVGVAEHVYVCGRQHIKAQPATFRACDTGVFFLQSSSAAARWPVDDAKLAELRRAFEATNV